jgi:Flp pilus assembly CpaF family ATPase
VNKVTSLPGTRADQRHAEEIIAQYRTYLRDTAGLLDEDDITDISRNPNSDVIWAISNERGKSKTPYTQTEDDAEAMIGKIVAAYRREFNEANPILECVLPFNGARFTALRRPIVNGVAWTIRKPNTQVFTFEHYVESGIFQSEAIVHKLRKLIAERKNILVAGAMGSGKTTLTNTLIAEIDKYYKSRDRWLILEDTDELRCTNDDHIKLQTNTALDIGFKRLIETSLRLTGTRIVMGEIRSHGRSVLEAWQVGATGNVATIHGDGPEDAMRRFESILLKEGGSIDRHEIASTIHALVCIRRVGVGRLIRDTDVVRISAATANGYTFRSA